MNISWEKLQNTNRMNKARGSPGFRSSASTIWSPAAGGLSDPNKKQWPMQPALQTKKNERQWNLELPLAMPDDPTIPVPSRDPRLPPRPTRLHTWQGPILAIQPRIGFKRFCLLNSKQRVCPNTGRTLFILVKILTWIL